MDLGWRWQGPLAWVCSVAVACASSALHAQTPRALLPDDVLVVVESDDAGSAIGGLIDTLGAVPQDLPETVRTEIALGLTAIRLALGEAPSVLGTQLAQGGMALGFRLGALGQPEALLVLRPGDAKAARAFLDKAGDKLKVVERGGFLLAGSSGAARDALLRMERAPRGRWATWPSVKHGARNDAGKDAFADAGPGSALGSSASLAPAAVSNAPAAPADTVSGADNSSPSVIQPAMVTAAARAAEPAHTAPVRAYVDLAGLRKLGGNQGVASMAGGARFVLAPLLPALLTADTASLALRGGAELSLALQMAVPADPSAREPWVSLQPHAGAERTIVAPPEDALLVVALDRSLRALLQDPAKYLLPADATQAQAFLGVADQLDGARSSFVEDVMGGIVEPLVVYVVPPSPPSESDPPRLLLPGVAAVAALRDAKAEAVLTRTAQVILLIGNTERAQRHEVPFAVRPVRDEGDGVHGITARLPEWRRADAPPTEYGIEPTLLFGHGHVVLATTQVAARAMLAQVAAHKTAVVHGDLVELRGPALAKAIAQSLRPLVLARMLDEGQSERDAESFYAVLGGLLRTVRSASLEVGVRDQAALVVLRMVRQ